MWELGSRKEPQLSMCSEHRHRERINNNEEISEMKLRHFLVVQKYNTTTIPIAAGGNEGVLKSSIPAISLDTLMGQKKTETLSMNVVGEKTSEISPPS